MGTIKVVVPSTPTMLVTLTYGIPTGVSVDSHFVVTQAETTLPHSTNLGALATGLLKGTVTNGVSVVSSIIDNSSNWDAGYTYRLTSVSSTSPLVLALTNNILSGSILQASAVASGYLSATDWLTFNSKQSTLTFTDSVQNTGGTVNLVGDSTSPGNSYYYGTNGSGTKGFYAVPAAMAYPVAGIALSTGSAWGTSITDNSPNWNLAYSHKTTEDAISGLVFVDGAGVYSAKTIGSDVQAYSDNLASISGLSYSATAFVKMTNANTFTLDTSVYLVTESDPVYTAWYNGGSPTLVNLNVTNSAGSTLTDTAVVNIRQNDAFDAVYRYNGASVFQTDNTTSAKTTSGSFTVFAASGDQLLCGKTNTFEEIYVDINTASTAGRTLTFEYSNGVGTWDTLAVTDGTTAFTTDGSITFTAPAGWVTDTYNGSPQYYWVKITSTNDPGTNPSAYIIVPSSKPSFQVFAQAGDTTPAIYISPRGPYVGIGTARDSSVGTNELYVVGNIYSDSGGIAANLTTTTTSTDGLALAVGNSATGGTPVRVSPRLRFTSRAWDGSASKSEQWIEEVTPVAGASPTTSYIAWSNASNGSSTFTERMRLLSGGQLFLNTTDTDGTPAIGMLTVKGSTNDGSTNVQVWRDSDEANVATLDTNGKMSLTSDAVAVKPTATIVIASSTSRGKDAADYVCDGTNDEVQIQAAINSLPAWAATPATFGGEIKLLEGHYSIGATITVDRSIQIIGCGSGQQTVLELAAGANCDMFQLSPGTGNHSFPLAKFSDLMLDGNAANQDVASYAIDQADESAYDFYCINVWFNDWKGSSLHLTADYDHRIERCVFENQTTYAIDLERIDTTTDTAPMRMWITNCFAPTIYSHGAGTVLVQDLIIDNNIFVPQFDDRTAMNLSGVANLHVTNNSSLGETTTDNTYDWLSLDKAPILGSVIISNNTVRNGKWRYVVNLSGVNASASDSVLINGNTFHEDDGTTVIFNDANNIISGLTISNNIIQTQNDDSMTAIDVGAVNMAKIFGNHFQDGAVGIDISDATSDDVTIYGNSFDGLTTEITSSGDASHPALIYGNKSSASDTSVFVVSNAGKVQVNSAGDDKNVQLYHDDTNAYLVSSSGSVTVQGTGTFDVSCAGTGVLGASAVQNYGTFSIKTYDGSAYNSGLSVAGSGGTQTVTIASLAGVGSRTVVADANGVLSAPVSDKRLKKDITPLLTDTISMLKDENIKAINYKWRDRSKGDAIELGFTAQMFEPYHIQGLTFEDKGIKGLNYEKLTTILWEQNKVQQKEIDDLKNRVRKLEQATEENIKGE
jgi:hypothetical protein